MTHRAGTCPADSVSPPWCSGRPTETAGLPSYLVLLRVGFALPAALLSRRCALTAPFHPYPGVAAVAVCFLWHFPSTGLEPGLPDVIRHTALWSSDFPPSPLDATRATVRSSCLRFDYSRPDRTECTLESLPEDFIAVPAFEHRVILKPRTERTETNLKY